MHNINHRKIIIITMLKILLMVAIFFSLNNWDHIKQSVSGDVPALHFWLDHALTPSNLIVIVLLSIVFYMNTLKEHKERAKANKHDYL
jgi:membrane protein insertase Oxa1/YidC/SpoIIIJ